MPECNAPWWARLMGNAYWKDCLIEAIGYLGMSVSIFLLVYGSWVWAGESIDVTDAFQNRDIAVNQAKIGDHERRIGAIEDRLFGILMTTLGAIIASVISSTFSIRTYRKVIHRNNS